MSEARRTGSMIMFLLSDIFFRIGPLNFILLFGLSESSCVASLEGSLTWSSLSANSPLSTSLYSPWLWISSKKSGTFLGIIVELWL